MAGIYICLALITAVIFFITRLVDITIKKGYELSLKIDFNLFSFEIIGISGRKNSAKKKDAQFYKDIYKSFTYLLSRSSLKVKRLCLPLFPIPNEPSEIPFLFANRAISSSIISYLRGRVTNLKVEEDAAAPAVRGDLYCHIILRTRLTTLIYTAVTVGIDLIKNKKRIDNYG